MATLAQIKRKRLIHSAEGYLEMAELFVGPLELSLNRRRSLASLAIEALNQIKNPGSLESDILYLKGQAHRISKRWSQAARAFEKAWQLAPENLQSLLGLGWCYKRSGQILKAKEVMIKGVELEPESAIAHYNLACYAALSHETELSLKHLEIALSLHPDYVKLVESEKDFDSIRSLPRFAEIFLVHTH